MKLGEPWQFNTLNDNGYRTIPKIPPPPKGCFQIRVLEFSPQKRHTGVANKISAG